MTRFNRRPVTIAVSAALAWALVAPVAAQDPSKETTGSTSMREQRAKL